jgi:NitT/TauT family transport system substrate-binding protein
MIGRLAWAACAALLLAWAPRTAAADDTLVVAAALPSGIDAVENVAQNAGLYKAEHLIVDKQYSGAASTCAQLAATGKIDICATSIEPTILGYEKGLRLQLFFSRVHAYVYELVTLADSPIKTLADFKGQDIGETSVGATPEIMVNAMLAGAGLKPSDYQFVPVGVGAQALLALTSHKVAAYTITSMDRVAAETVAHLTFHVFRAPLLEDIPNSGFAASPATVAAKGDLLQRYARANVKAALLIRENPQAAARFALMGRPAAATTPDAVAAEATQLSELRDVLAAADPASPRIGYTSVAGVARYDQFIYDAGVTKSLVPAAAIVTNQFIAYANDFNKKAWIAEVRAMHVP